MKQIKGLDTLRALAVLFVIIEHWGPPFFTYDPIGHFIITYVIPDGATGVYIFFTLSGFLITTILLNARFSEDDPNKFSILKNFIARRILRIFPLYYLFLFAFYQLFDMPGMKEHLPWFLTYTTNILCFRTNSWNSASHLWTLAIEEQFYIVWPWLILFLNRKYLKYLFIASIVIGIVTTYNVLKVKMEPFLMHNCMDSFAIGGMYAYARLNAAYTKKFEKIARWVGPFLLIPYFGFKLSADVLHTEPGIFMKKTVESLLTLWLIVLIINNKSERARRYFLENRALTFAGKISYCIYLIHPYVPGYVEQYKHYINTTFANNTLLREFLTGKGMLWLDSLAMVIFICWLSYVLIERPILSLKRFFGYSRAPG